MEEKLIEQVRLHEVLFNYKLANYRDQHVRQEAWEDIGRELQIQAEKAKDLWDRLRRCFCNAISRRRNKKIGQAAKKITPWKFEHKMSFVLPYLEKRKAKNNLNSSIVYKERSKIIDIDPTDKTQDLNVDKDQNIHYKITEILTKSLKEGKIDEVGIQNVQSFENHDKSETNQIKYDEKDEALLNNSKKTKNAYSNNNFTLQMLGIMNENAALRKIKQEEKNIQSKFPSVFENIDETDIFFLSMSKMTKLLPKVEQAKIKLLLSNSVLQAEIRNMSIQIDSLPISSPIPSEATTSSSQYSTIISEKSHIFNLNSNSIL